MCRMIKSVILITGETMLTKKEKEMMKVFWAHKEPLNKDRLAALLPGYNRNTMQSVIRRLCDKKYLEVAGFEINDNLISRTFIACQDESDCLADSVPENKRVSLVKKLIDTGLSKEELNVLKEAIEKAKAALGENV